MSNAKHKEARAKLQEEKIMLVMKEVGCSRKMAETLVDNSHINMIEKDIRDIKKYIDRFGIQGANVYLDREWINSLVELYIASKSHNFSRGVLLLRRLGHVLKNKLFQIKFLPHIPDMSTLIKIVLNYPLPVLLPIAKVQNIEKRRIQIKGLIDNLPREEK